ncbi:PspC domain-containing protein [Tessaracoccus caeni]|uniref:PspC domain-containing protein n=1 Tax=Tessaracoccus caeni TaxID=3031239 RepID=UPI0023DC6ADC|nr:PspC domain-containing protein [Tessaracoccus caeni]MDF1488343.1 PspC domain-containing protein [Tessaracoccus caeni]
MQESRSLIGWVDPRLEGLQRPADPGRTPGLCRAISQYTGFDVTLVRALFILLTLSTGVGVLLYAWGTILSLGADGRRPIDSLLPSFTQWSVKTQAIIVAVSAFLFMVSFGQMAPMPFVVAVVVLILLYAATSRARRSPMPSPPSPRTTEADSLTAAERAHSVDEWRAAMQQAVNHPVAPREPDDLPVLDLYGPQPEPEPQPPKPKSSWATGTLILLSGTLAFFAGAYLAPWTPVAVGLGIAAAVMGGLTFISALTLRGRQVPRLVLGIVASTALASAVLPMIDNGYYPYDDAAEAAATMMADEGLTDIRETITAGSGGKTVVDLSDRAPGWGERVTYEVYASDTDLTVRIPAGQIEGVSLNGDYVELPPSNYDTEAIPMYVEVYGDNVDLTVRFPESITLPAGISLERDLSIYDLSDYSETNPLVFNISGEDAQVFLTVPKGKTWVTQDGSDLLGEEGKMPLVVNVTGEAVTVTLKEI